MFVAEDQIKLVGADTKDCLEIDLREGTKKRGWRRKKEERKAEEYGLESEDTEVDNVSIGNVESREGANSTFDGPSEDDRGGWGARKGERRRMRKWK